MSYETFYNRIKSNWDELAKPIDGLGEFERVLSQIGAVQRDTDIKLSPAALLIFIADNGIIEEGVSQSNSDVTFEVAKALGKGMSTVSHMAKTSGMDVFPVNVGIKKTDQIDGVVNNSVTNGTNNFAKCAAMTKEQMNEAIDAGRRQIRELKNKGYKIVSLGEMGIGNTTTSAAVLAGLKKLRGEDVCSRGAGLSDEGLKKKISVINDAIIKYNLHSQEVYEILQSVGGLDIAALTGAILEAYELNLPIISDGFITGVAALIAYRLNERVKENIIFSHSGRENGMKYIFEEINSKPVITADMALGEGTGTCIFLSAAKCALSVYDGDTRFSDINTEKYKRY